jgi:hypothetical protein
MRFSQGSNVKTEILRGSLLLMGINRNSTVDPFDHRNSSVQGYDELLCDGPVCEFSLHWKDDLTSICCTHYVADLSLFNKLIYKSSPQIVEYTLTARCKSRRRLFKKPQQLNARESVLFISTRLWLPLWYLN